LAHAQPNGRIRPRLRLTLAGALATVVLALTGVLLAGSALVEPAQRPVGPPPPGLPIESVSIESTSGATLRGWFARGQPGAGGVLLLHELRGDRRSMLGRAGLLHGAGYSVLLLDLQAHGESGGRHVTFGHLESRDARAGVGYLRQRLPGEPVAAVGRSLGGAACLLGEGPLAVDALVLEAVYADFREAVRNRLRLRFGLGAGLLEPLFTLQLRARLGIDPANLRPVAAMRRIEAPVLIIAGELDRHTALAESRRLFDAAPGPKALWVVTGAAHEDLHGRRPAEWGRRVLAFLGAHLRDRGGAGAMPSP
jgi:fermentation-respiration switch protein FrsA (DUF1100 family)